MGRARWSLLLLAVAGCAVATGWLQGWHHSGQVPPGRGAVLGDGGIDATRLAPLYRGRLLSPRELYLLQRSGRAQAGVVSGPLACQGISLQFDTEGEADRHMAQHPSLTRGGVPCTDVVLHPAFTSR